LNMILAEDVVTESGLLLIAKGQEVTPSAKRRLRNFEARGDVREMIRVIVPAKESQEDR